MAAPDPDPRRYLARRRRCRGMLALGLLAIVAVLGGLDRLLPAGPRAGRVTVVRALDAHRLLVAWPDGSDPVSEVRVVGIRGTGAGGVSRTRRLVDGRTVRLEPAAGAPRDGSGRWRMHVCLPDGTLLAERLLRRGAVRLDPDRRHRYRGRYERARARGRLARAALVNHDHRTSGPARAMDDAGGTTVPEDAR